VLWCLKWVEWRIGIPRRASLLVAFDNGSPVEEHVAATLAGAGYEVAGQSRRFAAQGASCEIQYELRWRDHGRSKEAPGFADDLARRSDVRRLEWRQLAAD
jgi:hypothetical protein